MKSILHSRAKLAFSLLLLVLFSFPVKALDAQDLAEYKVAGVQLGSTQEEAMQNMAEFFSINSDDITFFRSKKTMPITGVENYVTSMRYQGTDLYVDVRLTPSLGAKDTGYMVVYRIDGIGTPHGIVAMEENVEANMKTVAVSIGPATSIDNKKNSEGKDLAKGLWRYNWIPESQRSEEYKKLGSPRLRLQASAITFTNILNSQWKQQVKEWKADAAK